MRGRMILASALSGLTGAAITMALFLAGTHVVIANGARALLRNLVAAGEVARCEAAPSTWMLESATRVRTYGYDAAGASRNPDAPPLDDGTRARLLELPVGAVRVEPSGFFSGGRVLARASDSAVCRYTVGIWPPALPPGLLVGFASVLGVSVGLGASLLMMLLGILPLTRRIARVRAAADRVGEASGYQSAEAGSDDLGRLSADLDRAHERLRENAERMEQSHRDLQRHLANVAHDLRTPIGSLQLSLEQALAAAGDPERVAPLLTGAVRDLVYLGGLTANLRLASQLEGGWNPLAGGPASLGDAVERAVARCRLYASRKQISLELATPDEAVPVACNPTAAEQAVANLVDNAVIHGSAGGHVAVVLRVVGADGFELTILDDGPGVTADELPRLGQRTFRSDEARARDARGSGLGLAITREISERCGWRLAFAREEPQGLRVTIRGARLLQPTSPS